MGKRRLFIRNGPVEGIQELRRSLDFNIDPLRRVGHKTFQTVSTGQVVNKGPKANTLNDPLNPCPDALFCYSLICFDSHPAH